MKSDLTDIEVIIHHATNLAWLVSTDGNREKAVWVPKSACELSEPLPGKKVRLLTLPEQFAIDKGLV
jgi:hypothetical protein